MTQFSLWVLAFILLYFMIAVFLDAALFSGGYQLIWHFQQTLGALAR